MDSPFNYEKLELPREGLIKQELVTYEVKDGAVVKTVVNREFYPDDFVDSKTQEVLYRPDADV